MAGHTTRSLREQVRAEAMTESEYAAHTRRVDARARTREAHVMANRYPIWKALLKPKLHILAAKKARTSTARAHARDIALQWVASMSTTLPSSSSSSSTTHASAEGGEATTS